MNTLDILLFGGSITKQLFLLFISLLVIFLVKYFFDHLSPLVDEFKIIVIFTKFHESVRSILSA